MRSLAMDPWRFYAITHAPHDIMNPLSSAKLDYLVERMALPAGSSAIDIACGKGEFLLRLHARYRVKGVGVDISPFNIREAKARAARRARHGPLSFEQADARHFHPPLGKPYDASSCLGATWIYRGLEGTLRALSDMTKKGGLVVVGQPFWKRTPAPEYLAAEELSASEYANHEDNLAAGGPLGLEFKEAVVGGVADFDEYEARQWTAAQEFEAQFPMDHDLAEIKRRVARSKDAYLQWGRDTLGWGVYLFRKP